MNRIRRTIKNLDIAKILFITTLAIVVLIATFTYGLRSGLE